MATAMAAPARATLRHRGDVSKRDMTTSRWWWRRRTSDARLDRLHYLKDCRCVSTAVLGTHGMGCHHPSLCRVGSRLTIGPARRTVDVTEIGAGAYADPVPGLLLTALRLLGRCARATVLVLLVASMTAPVAGAEFAFDAHLKLSAMGLDGDPAFIPTNADVAYDSFRDRYMVVWQGTQPGSDGPEIYGRLVSRSNLKIVGQFQISHTPAQLATEEPTVTYNASLDRFSVLWVAKHTD